MQSLSNPLTSTIQRIGVGLDITPDLRRIVNLCQASSAVEKIDHITFVCSPEQRENFLERWQTRGFDHHGIWNTERFPANHIALIRGETQGYPWSDMVGLSVRDPSPKFANPPLDFSVKPAEQDQAQHIAFNIHADVDVEKLYQEMLTEWQIDLMTPVLYYTHENGAGLRQWFTAPVGGFFVEFVQRIPNQHGEPYSGFDPDIIDDLYQALNEQLSEQAA